MLGIFWYFHFWNIVKTLCETITHICEHIFISDLYLLWLRLTLSNNLQWTLGNEATSVSWSLWIISQYFIFIAFLFEAVWYPYNLIRIMVYLSQSLYQETEAFFSFLHPWIRLKSFRGVWPNQQSAIILALKMRQLSKQISMEIAVDRMLSPMRIHSGCSLLQRSCRELRVRHTQQFRWITSP